MAWDPTRPVPWRRMLREWLIFAPLMAAAIVFLQRDDSGLTGSLIGLIVSLPLYLGFGAVLAKFGYQRKTLGDLRAARPGTASTPTGSTTTESASTKARPAPTRRTSTGPNRPNRKRR